MLFRSYRKRKALQSYRHVLAARLRGLYGRRPHYTPEEVSSTVRDNRLSEAYLCYALAMYCERPAFDAWHAERGETCSYDSMWHELNAAVTGAFTGNYVSAHDSESVIDIGESLGAACDSGFDGGGFDGGGSCD